MNTRDDAEHWDKVYRGREGKSLTPSKTFMHALSLVKERYQLAEENKAAQERQSLDIASGSGRHSLQLAKLGFEPTLIDVSKVALQQASRAFEEAGQLANFIAADLSSEALPEQKFDFIVCYHYLDRDLLKGLAQNLKPGGFLFFCQPTLKNLEHHPRPSARFLLEEAELSQILKKHFADCETIESFEGWSLDERHEAYILVRKSAD